MSYIDQFPIRTLPRKNFPLLLSHINDPPKQLYVQGVLPRDDMKFLTVVGSRAFSAYGKEACEKLISGLAGYSIIIVSGLALGIDSIAHQAALDAGLTTLAIPGSGLDPRVLYPSANRRLAQKILEHGGALLSEFEPSHRAYPYNFVQRNRIMAGMVHAVLVIEADLKSGTLITAKYATDYNRDLLIVPGSIFSRKSDGPHMLMRMGATPVRTSEDILEALGFEKPEEQNKTKTLFDCSPDELAVMKALALPLSRDELVRVLGRPVSEVNATLMRMEIRGLIVERLGEIHIA